MLPRQSLRAFTLIELLVVIAIIGILSSVVLASLSAARDKASISSLQSNLTGLRTQAALIYAGPTSFDALCVAGSKSAELFDAATRSAKQGDSGMTGLCMSSGTNVRAFIAGAVTVMSKSATPNQWAASLRQKDGKYFCIDSTGYAGVQPSRGIDTGPLDMICQ